MLPGKGELQSWVIARVQNTCSLVPGLPGAVTAAIRRFRGMPLPQTSARQNSLGRCRDHRVSRTQP